MPALMFQGVSSGAGKSTLAALTCRYLAKEGVRVAPFKALNLSLNSFVTREGGEIGMAQAFQAMASGLEPSVDMNPLLLKPCGDGVMQLVMRGRPFAQVSRGRTEIDQDILLSAVERSLTKLLTEYDVVIIEGSGSPAEINLADRDIANMRTAEMAGSPVVLVGDIDKGGVFAALYGTYHLLEERHRSYVKGFIINKFRGDPSILGPGIKELERRMDASCLGVVPMSSHHLPEEDSLGIAPKVRRLSGAGDVREAWGKSLDLFLHEMQGSLRFDELRKTMGEGI